jgi:hypothetical protein
MTLTALLPPTLGPPARAQPHARLDLAIERFFRQHHDVASRPQLLALGATPSLIKGRVATGRWRRLHRGVFAPASAPLTDHGRLLAAVLACGTGALASHSAAAWLWGLVDDGPGWPVVSVFNGRSPRPHGVTVHGVKFRAQPSVRLGIPVVNPLRAMLDLAVGAPDDTLAVALDRGVAARLFTPAAVQAELDRWADARRPGLSRLRAVVDEVAGVSVRSPSVLQNVFARVVARAGLPPPMAEVPVLSGRYRLDFAYPDVLLAFEIDSREHHSDWAAVRRDHFRRRVLASLGWTVLVFTAFDVWRRADDVAAEVREALVSRGVRCEGTTAGGKRRPRRTPTPGPEIQAAERAPPCG